LNEISYKCINGTINTQFKCELVWIIKTTDDISWFNNVIQAITRTTPVTVLSIKIFLTERFQEENYDLEHYSLERTRNINNVLGAELYHGRPIIKSILRDFIIKNNYLKDINVFCCSIKPVRKETQRVSEILSSKNCKLRFIQEPFL